ncbi:hypothetical protein MMC25_000393 [Agyrium rufum]|nr:hypothetical protein [Agyrium rufum]
MSSKSSRVSKHKDKAVETAMSPRRFKPQLEETSSSSTRKSPRTSPPPSAKSLPKTPLSSSPPSHHPPSRSSPSQQPPKTRRFAPQLIETTKRTKKKGDTLPAHLPSDKTDLSPGDATYQPRHARVAKPTNLPAAPENQTLNVTTNEPPESRFSSQVLARKAPRRTSFRTPHLEPIQSDPNSDDSNDSNCPSLSTSPSIRSEQQELQKTMSRARETCDDRFSGYFLALAAKAAQKQLREQAMAAYINENITDHVDHFAIDNESDLTSDEAEGVGRLTPDTRSRMPSDRRDSSGGWDAAEMRKHREMLKEQRKAYQNTEADQPVRISPSSHAPETRGEPLPVGFIPFPNLPPPVDEMRQMRNAASPPMLGRDILFPKSLSPQSTKIETDQKPRSHHNSRGETVSRANSGLWTPPAAASAVASHESSEISICGLWNGVCHGSDVDLSKNFANKMLQVGLMTPRVERDDPFSASLLGFSNPLAMTPMTEAPRTSSKHLLPPTPTYSGDLGQTQAVHDAVDSTVHLSQRLEDRLDEEFDDNFVTQVYNYLSIGYPSMARKYDHELSKISGISVRDLRGDDKRQNSKGYVGVLETLPPPPHNGCTMDVIMEVVADAVENVDDAASDCARWRALRLYVREWGRQQPLMRQSVGLGAEWGRGARFRKGSWGI